MPSKILDLEKISSKVGLKVSKLREVLQILYRKKPIKNNDLIRETGISKSVMQDVKRALRPILRKPSQFVVLTEEGEKFVEEEIISPLIEKPPVFVKEEFFDKLKYYQTRRPLPKRNLDQFPATPETVAKRGLLLQERGDLEGSNILLLGDYDLTCLVLALLGGAKRILVVDIDRQILELIKEASRKENLKIECLYYDVREVLPKALKNSFDVVFSDPPYTPGGLQLFLSRAIEAAKENGVLYFCYGYSRRARERGLEAQRILTQSGLLIEEKFKDFNFYLGAELIGSRSSLYILKTTPKTKILIKGRFRGPIYTGLVKKEKFR